jgi:CDP-glucose 4,6-dehydratase
MNVGFWADRPTLVTGATGLVGGWLVERLLQSRASVVCVVRDRVPHSRLLTDGLAERVNLVTGDIRDQAFLERTLGEYEIDTVLHLAAQTIVGVANRNPVSTFESNIAGSWSLLEACRRSPAVKQIVVASSDKAYGDYQATHYDETMPLHGRFPYDVSKACTDMIAQSYAATYNLPVAITRCGNFFGGGDLNWSRLVPSTIRSLYRGQRPVIRSDGTYIRDYFYVEDGAAAYTLLAERLAANPDLRGEAFNFSYGEQVSVLELVEKLTRVMGIDLRPDIRNQATGEIPIQWLNADKARQRLAWQPTHALDEGLRRTVDWYTRYFARTDAQRVLVEHLESAHATR